MLKEFIAIKGHEDYEVSAEGKVRKIDTKKYKNQLVDRNKRKAVALPLKDGGMEVIYIQSLIKDHFSEEDLECYMKESGEKDISDYESLLKKYKEAAAEIEKLKSTVSSGTSANKTTGKCCRKIKNEVTGRIFNSFSEAAKYYGTTYNKVYDSIYNTGEFNGEKFVRL